MAKKTRSKIHEIFTKNTKTKYKLDSNTNGLNFNLDWIDHMEEAIPYIDNIFASPKRFIINEEVILDIEKTKKVTIESIKHLSKHTNFISEYNESEDFIKPSKLLNVLKEETFNTYENRFIYTLVDLMEGLVRRLEKKMQGLKYENQTSMNYHLKSKVKNENINCSLVINTSEKINILDNQERINNIKSHILSWQNSIVYKSLKKERAAKVTHPIKRTNVILKNPNFQIAAKLWDYLYNFTEKLDKDNEKNNQAKKLIEEKYQNVINNLFLVDYLIMKNETLTNNHPDEYKNNIKDISVEILNQAIELLMINDSRLTLEEIIKMITNKYNDFKQHNKLNDSIIENKIKSSIKDVIIRMDNSYFEIERDVKSGKK